MDNLYFYTQMDLKELSTLLEAHSKWLDDYLHELYDEAEANPEGESLLKVLDRYSDELGLVEAHPIHPDLSLEDFEMPKDEQAIGEFFKGCKTNIFFHNIADFNLNPLQVKFVKKLLLALPDVVVDDGGLETQLKWGKDFFKFLEDSFTDTSSYVKSREKIKLKPVQHIVNVDDPNLVQIQSIGQKLFALSKVEKEKFSSEFTKRYPELKNLIKNLIEGERRPDELLRSSCLPPKAYTDGVEKVNVYLNSRLS